MSGGACHLRLGLTVAAAATLLTTGCVQRVGVRPQDDNEWFRRVYRSALFDSRPSERTEQLLSRFDALEEFRRTPTTVLQRLASRFDSSPTRELALGLAELCYLEARKLPNSAGDAETLAASSLLYSYSYLFDDALGPAANVYDPAFRLACDLYNRSVSRLVLIGQEKEVNWSAMVPGRSLRGAVEFRATRSCLRQKPEDFLRFRLAEQYDVVGLRNRYRTFGLGVPLIALRQPPPPGERTGENEFLPTQYQQALPVTLIVRVEQSITESFKTGKTIQIGVELYDPLESDHVDIHNQRVELETDLTTPIAYMLDHAPPSSGIRHLLDAPAVEHASGLYMLTPFRPGKIPVIFVHGMLGTGVLWLQMMNDLLGDPEIRNRYQFWYFDYATGNPLLYSAYLFRESLRRAQQVFDPAGVDPAFNNMVIVGNSMGGLMARLCVTRGGADLWGDVTDVSIDGLAIPEEQKRLLERVFLYEPLPFVKRVVFMVTPHRGSALARTILAGLTSATIRLSPELVTVTGNLSRVLGDRDPQFRNRRPPTGIDNLLPDNPLLRTIGSRPIPSHVTYHSIIANVRAADTPNGDDLIVPYSSAHLDGAASEKIVKGTHFIMTDPAAIMEVRRILTEHLAHIDSAVTLGDRRN